MPVNASGDITKFWYFFPDRLVGYAATPEEAQAIGVHYFFLAPKDALYHYGRMTPEFAAWIEAHGVLLSRAYGNSYGQVSLYRVDQLAGSIDQPSDVHAARLSQQTFRPPIGNPVPPFLLALGGWILFMAVVAVLLDRGVSGVSARRVPADQRGVGQPLDLDAGHERA